ncbi:MAG: SagB/ThcOx family dehydrogenase [Marinilabiliaceae bacterium]|nr:SagB/ThcOx family dehydrogenase [Marinilabiliaceae bacterium]
MRTIFMLLSLIVASMSASAQDVKKLPEPNKDVKMTLFQSLQQRKSVREYSGKEIDDMKLSQLLWAAVGINRPDGHLTAPTAINAQDITVYVCSKDGAWLYVAKDNALQKVSDKDLRDAVASRQKFAAEAPISLVIVSDNAKFRGASTNGPTISGAIDAGYVSQNIDLACEALGLATVPRATMDKDALKTELKLTDTQNAILNHPIGYPKK